MPSSVSPSRSPLRQAFSLNLELSLFWGEGSDWQQKALAILLPLPHHSVEVTAVKGHSWLLRWVLGSELRLIWLQSELR